MTGAEIAGLLAILSASVNGIKTLVPIIRDALSNSEEISQEELDSLRKQYDSLRTQAGGEFTGPQWELSGR